MIYTTFSSSSLLTILIFFFSISLPCFSPVFSRSIDTLSPSDSLSINQTLISYGGKFELGFFKIENPTRYYLGIWYKDIPSKDIKVWVANRDAPSLSNSSTLKLRNDANLTILDDKSVVRWSSNKAKAVNPVLQLLDSGNLVIHEAGDQNSNNYIWQSFDDPTDTLLPGQKLGWNLKAGLDLFLSSWRSPSDPGTGNVSLKLNYKGDPEIYLWNGNQIVYRSGPWVGQRFSGVPEMNTGSSGFNFTFYDGSDEVYYTFESPPNSKATSRLRVTYDGFFQRWVWAPGSGQWTSFGTSYSDQCDRYMLCGPYAVCNSSEFFVCQCPQWFEPKDSVAWSLRDASSGCVRKTKMDCESDGFLKLDNMKLPDTSVVFVDRSMKLDQCRDICKSNCSCMAYANSDVVHNVGSGCIIWTDNLLDMRDFVNGGQDIYIRLAASDLGNSSAGNDSNNAKKVAMGVGITVATIAVVLTGLSILIILKRQNLQKIRRKTLLDQRGTRAVEAQRSQEVLLSGQIISSARDYSGEANKEEDFELPLFDLNTIVVATNNFSRANELGQGGFGRVYKGVLLNGKEIAVKRLSRESGQGVEEFKNEVRLIAKLQHRNLVRLFGCCVEMDEKMLIYEYMKNKSLDSFLFDKEKRSLLNWETRFNILCGIARGLLYLHQDSRYRIIHRDLKASNILLDGDMNPKISDFGMARFFGGDEPEGNTKRVVGTYGYMAPEYAMDGLFSTKSDVFSFGVLVLEIVSGQKNRGFYSSDHELNNLYGYAFKLWKEGKGTEILDKSMGDLYSVDEALRCLQVGLLCVQERAEERPTMASVVLILTSESASLPQPKIPGFFLGWNTNETDSSSSKKDESFTVNEITITLPNAR